MYECALKVSGDEMRCLPWDQLLLKDQMEICDRGNRGSLLSMIRSSGPRWCSRCIPDCNTTTYAYSVTREKLKASIFIVLVFFRRIVTRSTIFFLYLYVLYRIFDVVRVLIFRHTIISFWYLGL